MRHTCLLSGLLLLASAASAGEPVEMVKPAVKPPAVQPKKMTAMELVAEEEKWQFRPTVGRGDAFVDHDAVLKAEKQLKIAKINDRQSAPVRQGTDQPQSSDVDQLVVWARSEELRVRSAVAGRRYEEAIKVADSAVKPLEPHLAKPEVAAVVVSIRTYRAQAEEAKVRDDAQAAFDALKLRVLGVLWSQDGARMAIVDGETRALVVNDRVKDCVIINIDQDRVDFRFHFGRRRFEFPVYVEQLTARGKP
jgi:hypothetical protein